MAKRNEGFSDDQSQHGTEELHCGVVREGMIPIVGKSDDPEPEQPNVVNPNQKDSEKASENPENPQPQEPPAPEPEPDGENLISSVGATLRDSGTVVNDSSIGTAPTVPSMRSQDPSLAR